MASTVYYGMSQTEADVQEKEVILEDANFNPNNLIRGDILVVYFAHRNEIDNPTLILNIGDSEQEHNNSNAGGDFTYNTGVIPVLAGAWADGEVVTFCYTYNDSVVENADQVTYWEIVGKPVATDETYGDVKIAQVDDDEYEDDAAASIGVVKELIGDATIGQLDYDSVFETVAGTLTLAQYEEGDSGHEHPIEGTISTVQILVPTIPTNVSEFTNDAGYITNSIIGSLDFVDPTNDVGQQLKADGDVIIDLKENETDNVIINGLNDIVLNPEGQVIIGSQADNDNLTVYGNIYANNLDAAGITVDTIDAHTDNGIITFTSPTNLEDTVTFSDGIYIGNQTLEDYIISLFDSDDNENIITTAAAGLFHDYLKTVRYNAGPYDLSLGARQQVDFVGSTIHIDGYTPVGVITWETWCHGTSNPENANIFGVWWDNNNPAEEKLHVRVTALDKPAISVMVTVHILYKKNTYAITYDLRGGSNGPSTQYQVGNHATKIPNKKPVKEGFTFVGWTTLGQQPGEALVPSGHLMPGDTYTFNKNFTLTADWVG